MDAATGTVLGLLHPCDGDASIFTRFTEAQEERSWTFVLEKSFLLLFINKAHYVPEHAAEQHRKRAAFYYKPSLFKLQQMSFKSAVKRKGWRSEETTAN